jgi:YVTN family beta-propeller protein
MKRSRFLSIVVILVLLQACGAPEPAPVGQTPAGETPAGEATPAANTEAAPPTGGVIARNPSSSGPIAISEDDSLLVVVNNLDDSVSIINVAGDANTKVAQVEVGDEPRTVAISPDKQWAYVTNQGSGTVSVINLSTNQT